MKKTKKILAIILLLISIISFVAGYITLKNKDKKKPVEEVKTVDNIKTKEFDYVLYDNKSDLYKDYFGKLKDELTKEEINEEEYAKLVSELFVIDFYSLIDKKTNTDIGGLDFIYESMKENFVLKASDTIYKYVESNVYGDRMQTLPKVTEVSTTSIIKKNVTIKDLQDPNGYVATISIKYDKDLKYPTSTTITLVHKDKKLYIVEVK